MEYSKNMKFEENDSRYERLDTFVCRRCFSDRYIVSKIIDNFENNGCSYCDDTGSKKRKSTDINLIIDHIISSLCTEYEPRSDSYLPSNDIKSYNGGYAIFDLINDYVESSNQHLLDAIAFSVYQKEWIRKNPWDEEEHEVLTEEWEKFTEHVKFISRFGVFKNPHKKILMLMDIVIKKCKLIKIDISRNIYYRARKRDSDFSLDISQLGPPKKEDAKYPNRMSPAFIPLFYLAENEKTALSETVEESGEYVIAKFKSTRDVSFIDLSIEPTLPSIFYHKNKKYRQYVFFFRNFVRNLTRAMRNTDKGDLAEHLEYLPTQLLTEYLKLKYGPMGIIGVKYRSSKNQGNCYAFFLDQESVKDAFCLLEGSKICRIENN